MEPKRNAPCRLSMAWGSGAARASPETKITAKMFMNFMAGTNQKGRKKLDGIVRFLARQFISGGFRQDGFSICAMRSHSHTARHNLWRTGCKLVEHTIAYQLTSVTSLPRCLDIFNTFELANIVDVALLSTTVPFFFFSKNIELLAEKAYAHMHCKRLRLRSAIMGQLFLVFFIAQSWCGRNAPRSPRSELPRCCGWVLYSRVLLYSYIMYNTSSLTAEAFGNTGPRWNRLRLGGFRSRCNLLALGKEITWLTAHITVAP